MPQPEAEACNNCAFFIRQDGVSGDCCAHAPRLAPEIRDNTSRGTWPNVLDIEWCHEWTKIPGPAE